MVLGALVFRLSVWCGVEGYVSGLWAAGSSSSSSPQTGQITLSSTPYQQLENQAPNTTGSNNLYNTLELLTMGIVAPETC